MFHQLAERVHDLSPFAKRRILTALDGLAMAFAACVTIFATLSPDATLLAELAAGTLLVALGLSVAFGLHRTKLNSFLQTGVHLALGAAVCLAASVIAMLWLAGIPPTAMQGLAVLATTFGAVVLCRAILLHVVLWLLSWRQAADRVLIWGAGKTGQQLVAALRTDHGILPVGFVDDDAALQGRTTAGLPVHRPADIPALARRHQIARVLLAMPSLPLARQQHLCRSLFSMGLEAQVLPSFAQLAGTDRIAHKLGPLGVDTILGRSERSWDLDRRSGAYRGRVVLVSGAGGSVGAELCRHLLSLGPRRLVLFDQSEPALYAIHAELTASAFGQTVEILPVLGSVCDKGRVSAALQDHGVQVVIHAAAYKHVPLVEANPLAGLANNILGTKVLADASLAAGVERFVLISTDKAIRPTSVMGASKRLSEMIVQDIARRPDGRGFSLVRFGNVMGSSGSVIPLFRDQIAAGGPITLTHDDVTRYFMSLTEAAQLVLFAGSLDPVKDGDILVLDMGEPIRIRDLAARMITSAGLTLRDAGHPQGDIEISVIGMRAGEKLQEEPLIRPGMISTAHPKILRTTDTALSDFAICGVIQALETALARGDADLARQIVDAAVLPPRPDTERTLPQPLNARQSA